VARKFEKDKKSSLGLLTFTMVIALQFCVHAANATGVADQETLTLFGVDRTEPSEKGMTSAGLAIMNRALLALADSGPTGTSDALKLCVPSNGACHIQVRWISNISYAPTEVVTDIRLPQIDEPTDVFDGNGKRRKYGETKARNGELARGQRDLAAALPDPKGTRRTDIYGFLQAAADYFTQPATNKVLAYVSDLEDNEHFHMIPDLRGVDVKIYSAALRADPVAMHQLQAKWQKFLTEQCHARSVAFLPLAITPPHAHYPVDAR